MPNNNPTVLVASKDNIVNINATDPDIIRKSDLLHFVSAGGYNPGEEWAERYYHIETPDKERCGEMYTYTLDGYSYGIARPLSVVWVGYLYGDATSRDNLIYNGYSQVVMPNDVPALSASQ